MVDKRKIKTASENKNEQPKFRVVKGGRQRARGGVIVVEGVDGKTYYRCSCDRCNRFATLLVQPMAGKEVVCEDCVWIAEKAKPSTKVIRKGDRVWYATECDTCGMVERTPFLPKKYRVFLCNNCKREEDRRLKAMEPPKPAPIPVKTETAPEPPQAVEEPVQPKVTETHRVPCKNCGKILTLRFKPGQGESLVCSGCYQKQEDAKKRSGKPIAETRIFYNIECIICGRKETLDFVPKLGSEAICTHCFESKKRRYRDGENHSNR